MSLVLSDLVAAQFVLPTGNSDKVFKFRQKERSLMSLFWTIHSMLDSGKKMVLIMDKTEDLEMLNYYISKNGLSQNSLIIRDHNNFDSAFWLSRFRDDWMQKNKVSTSQEEHQTISLQLEDLLQQYEEDYNKLHQRKLFPKSVVEINDLISNRNGARIDTSAKMIGPVFNYIDYQARKKTFEEAESLYDPKFRYCAQTNPFNKETIKQVDQGALASMLSEMKTKGQSILSKMKSFEKAISDKLSAKYNKDLEKLKIDILQVNRLLIKASPLTETEVTKQLFFQKELFESLDIPIDPPSDATGLDEGFERIQQAAEVKLHSSFNKIQTELENYLDKLTPSNTVYPELKSLIISVNDFGKELQDLDLFKQSEAHKSIAFSYQKNNLEKMIAQLEYGQYFIYEHATYLEWLAFEERLTDEDRRIIDYLSKQDGFWGQEFETLFLEYFISYSQSSLNSVQESSQLLSDHLSDYEKSYHVALSSRLNQSDGYIQNIVAENWSDFLANQSQLLLNSYPLLIVTSDFYKAHCEKLTSAVDQYIFFNDIPRSIKSEEWLSNLFLGYDSYFYDLSSTRKDELSSQEEIDKNYFKVNRDFSYLSLSERNRGATYLGHMLKSVDSKTRIYQTKNLSIISLWSESKNAHLLSELDTMGIKEIVSGSQNFNLIPGLFADTEKVTYLLIEDDALGHPSQMNIAEQHLLKEDLLTAGIKIRSIDNYSLIAKNDGSLNRIIKELKQANPVSELAYT